VPFDHREHLLVGQLQDGLVCVPGHLDHLVERHGPESQGTLGDEFAANRVDIATGGQIHDRIGTVLDRGQELGFFVFEIDLGGGCADIGIDLYARPGPHRQRLDLAAGVSQEYDAPLGDFRTQSLGVEILLPCGGSHLFGDLSRSCSIDSGHACRPGVWVLRRRYDSPEK
jgi:hypothetical protein